MSTRHDGAEQHPPNVIHIPMKVALPFLDLSALSPEPRAQEVTLVTENSEALAKELESLVELDSGDGDYVDPQEMNFQGAPSTSSSLAPSIPTNYRVEMSALIPLLRKKAQEEDRARAFTPGFTGHTAQLNRDLYMYLQGMSNKIPTRWQWAVREIIRKEQEVQQKEDKYYQQFELLAKHFGFAIQPASHSVQSAGPIEVNYRNTVPQEMHRGIGELMEKYRITDAGEKAMVSPVLKTRPPKSTKHPSSSTPHSKKRGFKDMQSLLQSYSGMYNGGGLQHNNNNKRKATEEDSDDDSSSDSDKEDEKRAKKKAKKQ